MYVHINKSNNKKYVGITSNDPKTRWKNGYGYSDKFPIGRAIRKYGWENFDHVILYNDLSETEAKEIEKQLIKQWNTKNDKYGYNLTDGGDGVTGFKHSVDTLKKLSERAVEQNRFGANNPNYGHKWNDQQRELAKQKHKSESLSCDTLKKMSIAASKKIGSLNSFYGKHHTQQTKQKISMVQSRPVMMFDLNGVFINEFPSIKKASEYTHINKVGISNCCRGVTKTSGGYIWKYKEDDL